MYEMHYFCQSYENVEIKFSAHRYFWNNLHQPPFQLQGDVSSVGFTNMHCQAEA